MHTGYVQEGVGAFFFTMLKNLISISFNHALNFNKTAYNHNSFGREREGGNPRALLTNHNNDTPGS